MSFLLCMCLLSISQRDPTVTIYSIDGDKVDKVDYVKELESVGILVEALNFLVFQVAIHGDPSYF